MLLRFVAVLSLAVGLSCTLSAQTGVSEREKALLERVEKLEARVDLLEQKLNAGNSTAPVVSPSANSAVTPTAGEPPAPKSQMLQSATSSPSSGGLLTGTTFGLTLDGYYGYNFNDPIGRVNLLRADDPLSNSFSLNQATLVIEHAPDVENGRRAGVRVDLQYGQATASAQGNPTQESRPDVYRPLWQAYGTYVFPVGNGLTVDFGKWASSLGAEGNYTKDQINYSRGYLFNLLPYYHFGSRTTYEFNNHLALTWWLVNGIGQSEDFNNSKSTAFLWAIKPSRNLVWNVNYYQGVEGRDVYPEFNPGIPSIASQSGLTITPVTPAPRGRTHIFDSYVSWNVTRRLLLVGEGDYLISRVQPASTPAHVSLGAAYFRYRLSPRVSLAGRAEYLSDRGGLFSGATQALKETTGTLEYKFVNGFLARLEWRRDFSNQPFFLTDTPGLLKTEQNTATLGMIWWFGNKEGAW